MFSLVLFIVSPLPMLAHDGGAIPADLWTHWNTDSLILISLMLPLTLYVRGALTYPVNRWRITSFLAGIISLFIALISPLDALSASLFSAHMVQHLVLMLVAAPLLILSRPLPIFLRGLPPQWRKPVGKFGHTPIVQRTLWQFTRPLTILIVHIGVICFWHIPLFYSSAFDYAFMHALEHATFFFTALLFWWMIRHTRNYGGRVLSVFAAMMTSGLLGALMTFAATPWYTDHEAFVSFWGLSLLEDQQLAGLFMWIPAGVVYVVAAALLLGAWINAVERRVTERENRLIKEWSDA